MIRTGIYNLDQLKKSVLKDIFGKERNISLYLYRAINKIDSLDKRDQFAELILNRFNSDRNVIKRTYKNRFNKFDNLSINKIIEQKFEQISVLDIAISDGRASCYFLEQSIDQFQNFHYVGTDIQVSYCMNKRSKASNSYIITDENNRIVEITKPPFVWNLARTEGGYYFINNFLKKYFLKRAQLGLASNKYKFQEKFELIHPDFKSLIKNNISFQIRAYNLFDEIPGIYKIIRAMNILHFGYFNKEQLYLILNHIYKGLDKGGLFVEGSNEKESTEVEGGIYLKNKNGFILLSEPEKPSRIKEFVLDFRYDSSNE